MISRPVERLMWQWRRRWYRGLAATILFAVCGALTFGAFIMLLQAILPADAWWAFWATVPMLGLLAWGAGILLVLCLRWLRLESKGFGLSAVAARSWGFTMLVSMVPFTVTAVVASVATGILESLDQYYLLGAPLVLGRTLLPAQWARFLVVTGAMVVGYPFLRLAHSLLLLRRSSASE